MFAKFVGFVAKRSVHIVARTCLNRINKDQSGHVVPKDYFCRNVDLEPPFAVFATARRPSSVIDRLFYLQTILQEFTLLSIERCATADNWSAKFQFNKKEKKRNVL